MARKELVLIVADRVSNFDMADADLVIALIPEPKVLKHRWAHAADVEVRLDPRIQIEAG